MSWGWEGMSKQDRKPTRSQRVWGRSQGPFRELMAACARFLLQVVNGSQGEGPAEEVTLLGWAESWPQAASWAVPLPACTEDTKFALLLSELGWGKPFDSQSGPPCNSEISFQFCYLL